MCVVSLPYSTFIDAYRAEYVYNEHSDCLFLIWMMYAKTFETRFVCEKVRLRDGGSGCEMYEEKQK